MNLRPTQHRRESKKQQHRIQQNKPRNRGIRVLKQHHQRHQPDGRTAEIQLLGRIVSEGHAEGAEGGVEEPHEGIVDVLGVFLAGLEFEGAVVAGEVAGETDEHFPEGWVHVEVEFAFEVVGAEFAEAGKKRGMLAVVLWYEGWWMGGRCFGEMYWASSQVTMLEIPILHVRVKKARKVKISGAIMNSHSSSIWRRDCSGCWN